MCNSKPDDEPEVREAGRGKNWKARREKARGLVGLEVWGCPLVQVWLQTRRGGKKKDLRVKWTHSKEGRHDLQNSQNDLPAETRKRTEQTQETGLTGLTELTEIERMKKIESQHELTEIERTKKIESQHELTEIERTERVESQHELTELT